MTPEKLKKLLDEHFTTASGRLNTQALTEKGFKKRGLERFKDFELLNLTSVQEIYNFLHNETSSCPVDNCEKHRQFYGYKTGYSQYCEYHGRRLNNITNKIGHKNFNVENIYESLKSLKDKRGLFSSSKINKLTDDSINKIKSLVPHITSSDFYLSEYLYCIENKITYYPECVVCGSEHNRFVPNIGYSDTCSSKCKWAITDLSSRTQKQRGTFYEQYIEKYKTFINENDGYLLEIFSKEDYVNNNSCSVKFKHSCGHEYELDIKYQGKYSCPKCFPVRSRIQYDIFDWLNTEFPNSVFQMNNRQIIRPKELDIVSEEFKFAIEYDGQHHHSFGKNGYHIFNNAESEKEFRYNHIEKTNLAEEQDFQLFHIFSSEWLNETKQSIWKSVIASKIGSTNRLYARKCQIREVDSKTSKQFLEENHLQGNVNAKYRYGLYFENELVSLMTFGKTRRAKWKGENNYELLRFCTKLNFTVVGGASRLLKHFEKVDNPDMILSYANRRWSTGNLYEKLNFEFIENTRPNYFYFKGSDDANLLSREQFQKHKLKDKLEVFDGSLTETENMYNNGYRKIYDSGHKIYIKNYK